MSSAQDVLRRVEERTREYDFTVWFWGDAIAFDGLVEASELLRDLKPREYCLRFFRRWSAQRLGWVDHLTPGWALLRLYQATQDRVLLDAGLRLASWILEEVPRSRSGAPLYRPDQPAYRN